VAFQSTPPMREATSGVLLVNSLWRVSIHASHAGGDANLMLHK